MNERDSSGAIWASDQEKEILWHVTTTPASIVRKPVWCEQLEKDARTLHKVFGALHSQTWTFCHELQGITQRTNVLFTRKGK